MPKLKPAELESRRREIIAAARSCFLRDGFHRTTTDQICREASITPGGLYHYFRGKDEIIGAVIDQSARETVAQLRSLVDEAGDMRAGFRNLTDFFFQTMFSSETDNETRLDIEIWAETLKDEKLSEAYKQNWGFRRAWLESMLQQSADEGFYQTDNLDIRGLASLLMAILVGLRLGRLLWRDEFDLQGAIRQLFLMHAGHLAADIPQIPGINVPAGAGQTGGSSTVLRSKDAPV